VDSGGSFGALLQLTARPGQRDEVLRVLRNYLNTLDGEPGTTLVTVALDPGEDEVIWMWEEFADAAAVQAHFEHDFFRALQLELADLLASPVLVRPMTPVARRVGPGVPTE